MKQFTLACVLSAISVLSFAQTSVYINDSVWVPMRSGPSTQHRIVHRGIISGTQLTLLEEQEEYSHVKTRGGLEGWIPNQYLTSIPVAKIRLKQAETDLANIKERNQALAKQIQNLSGSEKNATQTVKQLSNENTRLKEELEHIKSISAKALQLDIDNKQLLETNKLLRSEVDVVKADNQRLTNSEKNEAFLNGIFAVIVGVILALVIPRLKPKKRHSEWA